MSSLDRRKERGRNTRAKLGGCATQGELWKDHHLFGAPLASRVFSESRVCACILLARLSLAEMRDHSQSKVDKSTDSLADVTVTPGNELCTGLE